MPDQDLRGLADFLVRAKRATYASATAKGVAPQRPGFKELEFTDGDWRYRDSYAGHHFAPGQEVVYYKQTPVWAMAYSGGMLPEFWDDAALTKAAFAMLKKALSAVTADKPFRGPARLKGSDFEYINETTGDISDFRGIERILLNSKDVFRQSYIGGRIV